MKLKYFSLIFSTIGILSLYLLSKVSQTPLIEIHEMEDYEGKQVIIEGLVTDFQLTKHGSQIITIIGENGSTTLFIEGKTDIDYGDRIQATGDVQKYKQGWELIVNNNRYVKILDKWENITLPLWQLAENPAKYRDLNVNVTGHIESISNTYFYIVDLEKRNVLIVFYTLSKNITLYPGQKVSISGKFSFDKEKFRYQIEIFDEKHGLTYFEE